MSIAGKATFAVLDEHSWTIYGGLLSGKTPSEIGSEIGTTSNVVVRAAKFRGWPVLNRDTVSRDRTKRIIAAREAGQRLIEIGKTYGVSHQRVHQILCEAGRDDLCTMWRGPRVGSDPWLSKTQFRRLSVRVSRILVLRRQGKSWLSTGEVIYPQMQKRWAAWRCQRDIKKVCKRYNLDPTPGLRDLRK